MKLIKFVIFSIVLCGVTGCAGRVVLLKNPEGKEVKCEVTPGEAMATGVINTDISIQNCVKAYEAAGYKKISE